MKIYRLRFFDEKKVYTEVFYSSLERAKQHQVSEAQKWASGNSSFFVDISSNGNDPYPWRKYKIRRRNDCRIVFNAFLDTVLINHEEPEPIADFPIDYL